MAVQQPWQTMGNYGQPQPQQSNRPANFGMQPGGFDYRNPGQQYGQGSILDHSSNNPNLFYGAETTFPTDYTATSPVRGSEDAMPDSWGTRAKNFLMGNRNEETGMRTPGMLLPMLNTFTGLASAYLGMKQYGLAKDSFKQSKKEFGLNYDAQRNTTNQQMAGIAKAQYSANPDFYDKPDKVMNDFSVRERTA